MVSSWITTVDYTTRRVKTVYRMITFGKIFTKKMVLAKVNYCSCQNQITSAIISSSMFLWIGSQQSWQQNLPYPTTSQYRQPQLLLPNNPLVLFFLHLLQILFSVARCGSVLVKLESLRLSRIVHLRPTDRFCTNPSYRKSSDNNRE